MAKTTPSRSAKAAPTPRMTLEQKAALSHKRGADYVRVEMGVNRGGASNEVYDAVVNASRDSRNGDFENYWMLYTRHIWVRTCVRHIADAVSSEGFDAVPVEGSGNAVKEQDARNGKIDDFLRNAFISQNSTFTRALLGVAVDLCVFGVGYWYKERLGTLQIGFQRLDPRTVSPILNKDRTAIIRYVVRAVNDTGLVTDQSARVIDPDDVLMFTVGGGDPLFGAPPTLESLDSSLGTDLYIRKHRQSFHKNGAVAGRVLISNDASEDDIKAAVDTIKSTQTGSENAFKTLILTGNWEVIDKASTGKNELDFIKGSEMCRDECASAFKIPVSKLISNVHGGLGQAGKETDDDNFQRDAVLPLEKSIYETLTLGWLHKEYGWTDIELVPKRLNQIRFDRFEAAEKITHFGGTGNEARDLAGLPPVDDPEMDIPLFIGGHQPFSAENADDTSASDGTDGTKLGEKKPSNDSAKPTSIGNTNNNPKPKVAPRVPKPTATASRTGANR